jgi:hypothetical protein
LLLPLLIQIASLQAEPWEQAAQILSLAAPVSTKPALEPEALWAQVLPLQISGPEGPAQLLAQMAQASPEQRVLPKQHFFPPKLYFQLAQAFRPY